MQNYKRIVSYIYSYEGSIKKNNIGFAKLEARGNAGRLFLKLNGAELLEEEALEVSFLYNAPELSKVAIEERCSVINGRIDTELLFDAENIAGTGLDLLKMQGLYFSSLKNPEKIFASQWIDMQIKPIYEPLKAAVLYEEEPKEEVELAAEVLVEPEEVVTVELAPEEEEIVSIFKEAIEELAEAQEEIVEEAYACEENTAKKDKDNACENVHENRCIELPERTPWDRLCCKYPKVMAFENNTSCMCLKIDLRAIELLLGNDYRKGSNTFAIRNYCRYKYLLLIENDKDKAGESCIFGVPGIYTYNDSVLAKMCGFEEFRTSKGNNKKEGTFGYWVKPLKL